MFWPTMYTATLPYSMSSLQPMIHDSFRYNWEQLN